MNKDELSLNNAISAVLENMATITKITAKLIESYEFAYMNRQELAKNLQQVSESAIIMGDSIERYNKIQSAQYSETPWKEQSVGPLSNN